MNDRPVMSPGGLEPGWETRLQETARAFNYPPTPDIAGRIRQRLAGERKPAGRPLAWAALVTLVILAGLLAVPRVRAAVAEWLQIGSVRIFLAEPTPTPTPTAQLPTTTPGPTARPTARPTPSPTPLASVLDLDGETSLAEVRTQVDFPVRLPTYPADLGPPGRVFLQNLAGPMVVLVWLDPDRPGQPWLSLHILGPDTFAGKTTPAVIQETEVHGRPAVWAEGPHSFILDSGEYTERRLVEGNVLIWTEDRLTYRLETKLPLQEALRIAESIAGQTSQVAGGCPLTPQVTGPDDPLFKEAAGDAVWYSSQDGQLWTFKPGAWRVGDNKVPWRKPRGAVLEITGRRLDGETARLLAQVPEGYPDTFQASGLIFPTAGCWELEARAGQSLLRFVVAVEPAGPEEQVAASCDDLAAVVRASNAILTGWVTESEPDPAGYVWQMVRVRNLWKNPYGRGQLHEIVLLQDTRLEPVLQPGRTYLLFLNREPFQLLCPAQTLAEITGNFVTGPVTRLGSGDPLWSGRTAAEIYAEVRALLE